MWAVSTRRPNGHYVGLNRFVNEAFGAIPVAGMQPAIDVTEDQQGVRIVAEIPGYKPESVKVAIENRVLTMSGEKANGSFTRSFTVPSTIDTDRIEASVEHGLLTVTLPKAEQAKPREIPVKAA
jgi:HSP20 family protein